MPYMSTSPVEVVALATVGSTDESQGSRAAALARLLELSTVMASCGVAWLRALGALQIQRRCLAAKVILLPGSPPLSKSILVDRIRTWSSATGTLGPSASAGLLITGDAQGISVEFPHWAADKIVIAPSAKVVLERLLARVVMLAEKIVIGEGGFGAAQQAVTRFVEQRVRGLVDEGPARPKRWGSRRCRHRHRRGTTRGLSRIGWN
jgi:hypothetical protein